MDTFARIIVLFVLGIFGLVPRVALTGARHLHHSFLGSHAPLAFSCVVSELHAQSRAHLARDLFTAASLSMYAVDEVCSRAGRGHNLG